MNLSGGDIFLILAVIIGLVIVALYFLNRWAARRIDDQQTMIEKSQQTVSIYVIDKKRARAKDANLPKIVTESLPKWYSFMKLPLVKAKVGPQITTLICDKKVFATIPLKRSIKVSLAGIYIVEVKGSKNPKAKEKPVEKKPWYKFWN